MLRRLGLTVSVLAITAGSAIAADPEKGSVSAASPTTKWTGTAFGPMGIPNSEGTDGTCDAPTCDTFSLDVADPGTALTFELTTTNYSNIEFEVEKPDGTRVYQTSGENVETRKTVIKNAPKGAYKVYVWAFSANVEPMEYEGTATLTTASSAPPAAGPTPPPAGQTPPPSGQAPPAAAPATTMSVKVKGGSARKLSRSRKLAATVTPSAPVSAVVAQLLRGKTVVASGKVARLDGAGTVTIKLRKKLKPGKYSVFVAAKDAQGRSVTAKAPLRLKK